MNDPANSSRPRRGRTVERYPVAYSPTSSTLVNAERLPDPEELRSMDLQYREQPRPGGENEIRTIFLALPVVAYLLITALYWVPTVSAIKSEFWIVLGCSSLLGIAVGAAAYLDYGVSLRPALALAARVALFAIGTAAIAAVSNTFSDIAIFPLAFALAYLVYQFSGDYGPVRTFREWLASDPRATPEKRSPGEPLYAQFAGFLTFGVFVAIHFAIRYDRKEGLVWAFAVPVLGFILLIFIGRNLLSALTLYFRYGSSPSGAPGVWYPRYDFRERQLLMLVLPILFTLTLIVSGALDERWLHQTADNGAALASQFAKEGPGTTLATQALTTLALFVGFFSFITAGPLIALARFQNRLQTQLAQDKRTLWDCYADRLGRSEHLVYQNGAALREEDHFFLGAEPEQNFPVLLDRKLLSEHCYIMGDSGSGKTSLGIMPLVMQLIRERKPGSNEPKTPIVIIDLKGDRALFHTAREEARARGQKFLFFTPEAGRASHCFNPFKDFNTQNRTLIQLCHLFLDALTLNHGEGYGRSYFSRRNRMLLFDALNHPSKPQTFDELYTVIENLVSTNRARYEEAFELVATIHALSQYPQLVISGRLPTKEEDIIHMPRVIEEGQVVYFWLPAIVESISAREIGKLALYSLLNAAIDRQYQDKPHRQAYVFIDEFQRIAGENFRIILEQARTFGISLTLANQTAADLKSPTVDLRSTVRTNTRVKMLFSVTEPAEIDLLSQLSGEDMVMTRTVGSTRSAGLLPKTLSYTESAGTAPKHRLTRADIQRYSDHPNDFILHVSRGSGYTQFAGLPIPVRAMWPLPFPVYEARSQAPWPQEPEIPAEATVKNEVPPKERMEEKKAEASRRRNKVVEEMGAEVPN